MPNPHEIATGDFGYSYVHALGVNNDVDAAEETMWPQGGVITYLTSEEALKISSAEAVDGAGAATGALTMTVYGLNGDYELIEETVTLTGTDVVTTDDKFLRVFKATVRTAGSGGKNAGLISIKNTAGTNTILTIPIGLNQSKAAIWTVPAGTDLYMTDFGASESNNKKSKVRIYVRPYGEVFQLEEEMGLKQIHTDHPFYVPHKFAAKTDIEMRCLSVATDAFMAGGFSGYYKTP